MFFNYKINNFYSAQTNSNSLVRIAQNPASQTGHIGVHIGIGGMGTGGWAPADHAHQHTVLGQWSTGVTAAGGLSSTPGTNHAIRNWIAAPAFLTVSFAKNL